MLKLSFLDLSTPTPNRKESCYHKTNFKEVEFCHFQILLRLKELTLWLFGRNTSVNKGHLYAMWQPGWEGVWGRMDTRICISESICYSPEIITTLLISCTPIPIKKALWDSSKSYFPQRLFFWPFAHIVLNSHTLI